MADGRTRTLALALAPSAVTNRLKELLLRERAGRLDLQGRAQELEGRSQVLVQQLEKARADEEQHRRALGDLEESVSRADELRAGQQAEEVALPPPPPPPPQ